MQQSETIKSLADALCKFQSGMGAITKDATNPFFKSKYASLSAIIEDTRKPLGENGLSFAQFPSGDAELTTTLMHSSGEWMSSSFTVRPVDQKPQSLGSAITYARRYALCAILGLQVDDDDGNEASKPKRRASYDTSPVSDDADVTSTGDDLGADPPKAPAKAPTPLQQKKMIKDLLDKQSLVPLKTQQDYADACNVITGLELTEANYAEIIRKITDLRNGKLDEN
jgi:hypothetical protein